MGDSTMRKYSLACNRVKLNTSQAMGVVTLVLDAYCKLAEAGSAPLATRLRLVWFKACDAGRGGVGERGGSQQSGAFTMTVQGVHES